MITRWLHRTSRSFCAFSALSFVLVMPVCGAPDGAAPAGLRLDTFDSAMTHGDVFEWRALQSRLYDRVGEGDRNENVLLSLGLAQWVLSRHQAAVETLGEALRAGADRATSCFHLALAAEQIGEVDEAVSALACARKAAPEDPFVLLLAGSRAAAAGDFATARADLVVADALAPPALRLRVLSARVSVLLSCACGDAITRRDLGERFLEASTRDGRAWLVHARLLALHEPADARDALRRARDAADTPQLWVSIADAHLEFGDAVSAQALLEEAAVAAPGWATPHARLGTYWSERDRWGWALDAWRRAVQRDRSLQAEVTASIAQVDPVLAERFLRSLDGN